MARIVIDARRISQSTGRYVRELINHLEKIDSINEYHVVIHEKDQGQWAPTVDNFFLHVTKYDHYTFGEQLGFAWFLYKLKPDLVHFSMPQQPLLYFGKRVTTVHDLTLVRFQNLDKNKLIYAVEQTIFKFLLKNVTRRSKTVITPSKFVRDDITSYAKLKTEKVLTTYEAATETVTHQPELVKSLEGKDFIFYVGNAFPHKNLRRLSDAHALLLDKHPNLHMVFAGKKEFFYEQVEAYVNQQGYDKVHFLGFVSDGELAWLYKHAKAYVFPSLSEGFGLPGLEVMQHQTPLVSSNATCLPEIYGDAAHYFEPTEPVDMARAIDEVLRSHKRRDELLKAADKQLGKYSWEKMAKQTLKIYQATLGRQSKV